MDCNLCGGKEFADFAGRKGVQCRQCFSVERTRGLFHIIKKHGLIFPGARVIHFAPELGLAHAIQSVVGEENYACHDLFPDKYKAQLPRITRFDMARDVAGLKTGEYDLILHSHVLEHIPCWVAPVLWHMHRAMKPTGAHLFCVPVFRGYSSSDFGPIGDEERARRFGQLDHVRNIGEADMDLTFGSVYRLHDKNHGLVMTPEEAEPHGINTEEIRRTVFLIRKPDLIQARA